MGQKVGEKRAPRRHTPYYHKFIDLGATMVDRIGFDVAWSFSSIAEEHLATRLAVGLYDVYYQGPLDIKGPDAEALLQRVLIRDVSRRMQDGHVMYSSLCNESGGMIDDLTCYRLGPEHFWLVPTPARADVIETWLKEQGRDLRAYVTNTIPGTAYLSVQGPRSREVLAGISSGDLSSTALPYFRFMRTEVAGIPTFVSRTGYSGELGFELYCARDYAEHMWDSVVAAGKEFGLLPCGLGALRSVRIEKKYPLYGLDLNDSTSPLEAGLSWAVDLDKGAFIGQAALRRQRDAGVPRLLMGIEFTTLRLMPSPGDAVSVDGRQIGSLTSGDRGYFIGRSLALAYLPPSQEVGSQVTVTSKASGESDIGTVSTRPFYDPGGARLRS
jgi:aminomethyltransferase